MFDLNLHALYCLWPHLEKVGPWTRDKENGCV